MVTREIELDYIEKGTFQGGDEECAEAGFEMGGEYIFVEKSAFEELQARADKLARQYEGVNLYPGKPYVERRKHLKEYWDKK